MTQKFFAKYKYKNRNNAEFDADFDTDEKNAIKFLTRRLQAKKCRKV
jgi:hypothetical protein